MIQIVLNGEPYQLPANESIASLLTRLELLNKRVAVEVNQTIVPRSQHEVAQLHDADRVEIIHAVGGG